MLAAETYQTIAYQGLFQTMAHFHFLLPSGFSLIKAISSIVVLFIVLFSLDEWCSDEIMACLPLQFCE